MEKNLSFGDCRLSVDGLLSTPQGVSQITRLQSKILRALVHSGGVAVSTDRLLDLGWGKGAGTPQNLAKVIFALRNALAGSESVRLQSIYGHGYRFAIDGSYTQIANPMQVAATRAAVTEAAFFCFMALVPFATNLLLLFQDQLINFPSPAVLSCRIPGHRNR